METRKIKGGWLVTGALGDGGRLVVSEHCTERFLSRYAFPARERRLQRMDAAQRAERIAALIGEAERGEEFAYELRNWTKRLKRHEYVLVHRETRLCFVMRRDWLYGNPVAVTCFWAVCSECLTHDCEHLAGSIEEVVW